MVKNNKETELIESYRLSDVEIKAIETANDFKVLKSKFIEFKNNNRLLIIMLLISQFVQSIGILIAYILITVN